MPDDLWQDHLAFDPAVDADIEALTLPAPARWAVYLFSDANDGPIQLLSVKNLRASLRRRLGGGEVIATGPSSRKVDYRQIVRRISWRRVDSALEADLAYLEAARACFPGSYRKLAGLRPAWFVHVDPSAEHPRYTRTTDLTPRDGERFGPLPDRDSAGALIEKLQDWFDLCRYHEVLVKSPYGRACAYKEMRRCPAPCDGSVSMDGYRRQVELSIAALLDPSDFLRMQEQRMQSAAGELRFESAARIRQYVQSISSSLGKGDFRHVRRLRDLRFLALQPGPSLRSVRPMLITPGAVRILDCVGDDADAATGLLREALYLSESVGTEPIVDELAAERLGVITHNLFTSEPSGVFIPLDRLDAHTLSEGLDGLRRQRRKAPATDESGDEGVQKQLQNL